MTAQTKRLNNHARRNDLGAGCVPSTRSPTVAVQQAPRAEGNLSKNHHHHEAKSSEGRLGLKRIHHSPVFWVGAGLFLLAIAIYVLSDDLSWQPSVR
jgi:hypothetical protein